MGFLDICKSAINYITEEAQKMQEEYDKYYNWYQDRDDEQIIREFNSSRGMKKRAMMVLLKERGYTREDIMDE